MKKLLSIFAACLILVSGMHFTMSMHFCRDNISAVTLSLLGTTAHCGMDSGIPGKKFPEGGKPLLKSACCNNTNIIYTVDNYNSSSQFSINETSVLPIILSAFLIIAPVIDINPDIVSGKFIFPEKDLLAGSVPLEGLCVFRI